MGGGGAGDDGGGDGADLDDATKAETHAGGGVFGEDFAGGEEIGEGAGEGGEGERGGGADADGAGAEQIKAALFAGVHLADSVWARRFVAVR